MILESLLAVSGILLVGVLMHKKVNATVALFAGGLLILMVAPVLGHTGTGSYEIAATGNAWLDQFGYVAAILSRTTAGIGMIIMVLFGFSAYMSHIGANQMATTILTRPLLKIKVTYLLVPLVFWVGNLMSLAVPSASALAVLLIATLLPAMVGAGIKPITAAAVIATTATIMPTPLGADNIIAAERLGIALDHYVFGMHALISIPTLIVMGVAHYFWQRYMDRRTAARGGDFGVVDVMAGNASQEQAPSAPSWYAILPVLPLLFVLIPFLLRQFTSIDLSAELIPVTLLSVLIAATAEMIRRRSVRARLEDIMVFFKGMGTGFGVVVALVVAANVLVEGIIQIGVVSALSDAVAHLDSVALVLFLGFAGAMLLLALLTGGVAPFYSLVEIAPKVAEATGVNGALLILPMQFVGNLTRAMSPVAAVVLIVCGAVKVSVGQLIARTCVPMAVGIVMSMVMTWFIVGA
ncbi:C4-dicarboxylate transporter DcuC [Xylanimonas ulmi]|uniref:DcuC family C4-dicarboxylate transporter n=1 Tax=Xylanimonas ulmi TaxID=228973 RepID=A0A4Q7M5N9_9MICO|nr:C4-dicarboxylate transporter DcuC [Xylanibacterium ulmi]RZS62297.1 DcuC family C4-dicarboxylate transporter [Xylanibacterium ulmi]